MHSKIEHFEKAPFCKNRCSSYIRVGEDKSVQNPPFCEYVAVIMKPITVMKNVASRTSGLHVQSVRSPKITFKTIFGTIYSYIDNLELFSYQIRCSELTKYSNSLIILNLGAVPIR